MSSNSIRAIVFIFIFSLGFGQEKGLDSFTSYKIYTFRNKHDLGVLTAINIKSDFPPIVTDKWRDAATQKWRAVGSYIFTGHQLRPTSDEAKIVSFDINKYFISQDYPGIGFSSSQYWVPSYVGHGFHQLKNMKTDECLQSMGHGKRVGVALCVNSPKQQWQVDEI